MPKSARLSLRERNKRNKKARIQKAARSLFVKKGFAKSTTREIAELADVGLSTLFLYATDKRDLLFLVYNEDLDALNIEAFGNIPENSLFHEKVLFIWGYFYRYYEAIPDISRTLLKEIIFFSEGMQCARFQKIRLNVIHGISDLVNKAKSDGEIVSTKSDDHIAEVVFYLFSIEVRQWLARDEEPDSKQGLKRLGETMEILMAGLSP